MPHSTRVEPANRRFASIREDTAKMQHYMPVYYLAVPPLADRKRLFNLKTMRQIKKENKNS